MLSQVLLVASNGRATEMLLGGYKIIHAQFHGISDRVPHG